MCTDLIHSMGRKCTALGAVLALAASLAIAAPVVKTEHVEADLVAERTGAKPGEPAVVGLRLRMADKWHTYWKNPGDSGLPTRIQWSLPAGWTAGEIRWPYPQPLPVGPLLNYGYEDEVVLLTEITPPASAKPGTYRIAAKAEWLVCKDICIPEKGELDIEIPVGTGATAANPRTQATIERSRNMLPVEAPGWKFESALAAGKLVVRLTPPAGAQAPKAITFFPEREQLIEPAAPQKLVREGGAARIEMKLADPPPAGVTEVKGVAVADGGWPGLGRKAIEFRAPVGKALGPAAAGSLSSDGGSAAPDGGNPARDGGIGGSAVAAILFGLLGGVLLNLMPCVFPVLGIKVLGFVQHAHGDARAMRVQGWAYFAGTVLSFLILAAIMLSLRAGGTQLGWGFQLQSPVVVAMLAVLFFVLALNLSGVFEWGAFAQSITARLSAQGRYADAFLSGIVASVVATPCTAPFMGAAVGFTLTQDVGLALGVFAALGVGMALPVLALAHFPALLKRLPRPGAWMETFKQVLAFPLYATVAWLAWVLGAQAGNDSILALLGGLVLVAMGAWMLGRYEHAARPWRAAVAAILAAAGLLVAWPGTTPGPAPVGIANHPGDLPWEEWSPEKVASLNAQGRAVFVDFTAAWCVTCQVNKRVALNNEAVVREFGSRGVVPLRADWTRQDPRITQALSALGRNAVPVYALYLPGESAPRLLPEVLTPSLVLAELSHVPAGKAATSLTQR